MDTESDEDIIQKFPEERIVRYGGRTIAQVLVDEIPLGLNRSQMEFDLDITSYDLPDEIKTERTRIISHLRSIQPSTHFFDDNLWRLSDFEVKKHRMHFMKTRYFDYVVTNLAAYYGISIRKVQLLYVLEGGANLSQFRYSKAANPLGVVAMITTPENNTFLQKRSGQILTYPNMIGPSVSGTLDSSSCPPDPFSAIIRETSEELGIKPSEIQDLKYLGLSRDLRRAGQPDMYFVARTELSLGTIQKRIKDAKDSYETLNLLPVANDEIRQERLRPATPLIANERISPTAMIAGYFLSKHLA